MITLEKKLTEKTREEVIAKLTSALGSGQTFRLETETPGRRTNVPTAHLQGYKIFKPIETSECNVLGAEPYIRLVLRYVETGTDDPRALAMDAPHITISESDTQIGISLQELTSRGWRKKALIVANKAVT